APLVGALLDLVVPDHVGPPRRLRTPPSGLRPEPEDVGAGMILLEQREDVGTRRPDYGDDERVREDRADPGEPDGVIRALVEQCRHVTGPVRQSAKSCLHGRSDVSARLVSAEFVATPPPVPLVEESRGKRRRAERGHIPPEVVALGAEETREASSV